jgi:hypothetical protein
MQPLGPVKVDTNNSIGRKARIFFYPNGSRTLAVALNEKETIARLSVDSGFSNPVLNAPHLRGNLVRPWTAYASGGYLGQRYNIDSGTIVKSINGSWTFVAKIDPHLGYNVGGAGNDSSYLRLTGSSSQGVNIYDYPTGWEYIDFTLECRNTSSQYDKIVKRITNSNRYFTVFGEKIGTAQWSMYIDNVLQTPDSSANDASYSIPDLSVGDLLGHGNTYVGVSRCEYVGAFSPALSADERRSLMADPYQFLTV